MTKLDAFYEAFRLIGEDPDSILTPDTGYLVAHGHEILGTQSPEGLTIDAQATETGVKARVTVLEGQHLQKPVHLCLGLFQKYGGQHIELEVILQPNSEATLWSHCLFTMPEIARHSMDATIDIQDGAKLVSKEVHYHGLSGGIEVMPRAEVKVGRNAQFHEDFTLTQGRVGMLDINYQVQVAQDGMAELHSKVYGRIADQIKIRETVSLDGENAHGLVKSRVALEDESTAEVIGATYGNAAGARGHVDCMEIVRGDAKAMSIPEIRVSHPQAKVTHEAAIGSVDQKQLEVLMARGLAPDEAVDMIILGMLGEGENGL